jgi:RNA polymerase sigma-70 factor, ECF subfamily
MDDRPAHDPACEQASDEVLLRRFAGGDVAALGELARRHEKSLLGLARGLLDWRTDAACDAVQETWVRVIRYAGSFKERSSFKTWVYRIVINQCHTMRAKKRPLSLSHAAADRVDESRPQVQGETQQLLREQVAKLPEDRRVVVLLCYHDGLTHEQAAEVLEIPIGTLKSRLHAALTDLRKRMPAEVQP